jgi:hypothetical protein
LDSASMQQMMMLWMMKNMEERDGDGTGLTGAGKALRRLHAMHEKCKQRPDQIVAEFVQEWMELLGVDAGDRWQMTDITAHIQWGKLLSLKRSHYHAAVIFELMLRNKNLEAQAYMAQYLRALHQCSLDGGQWGTAQHLLPRADPIDKTSFGGSHADLETISAYQDALRKLRRGISSDLKEDGKGDKGGGKGKGGKPKPPDI